jgi:hypothetical protein
VANPILKFAVIGDIMADNQWCMAGVSRITPMVKKLGVSAVLAGDSDGWRIVKVDGGESFDLGKALKNAFAEKRDPLDLTELSGVPFLLCNTREMIEENWVKFSAEHDARLRRSAVFFYAQRFQPAGTGLGYFMPRQDRGCSVAAFKGRSNCVAFSSGSLGPLADERSIRQGDFGFTSVSTSSFRYASLLPGRENFEMKAPLNRPGLVVSVFRDRVEFKRILFTTGALLGDDWVMPLSDYGALSYERRMKASVAPEFPANAELKVVLEKQKSGGNAQKDFVRFEFPRAKGKFRPFEYEITVHCFEGDVDGVVTQRRMYTPGVFGSVSEEPGIVTCRIERSAMYYDFPLVFEVRAMDSFGLKGRPISVQRTIKSQPLNRKA